jgi:hypothetical protein
LGIMCTYIPPHTRMVSYLLHISIPLYNPSVKTSLRACSVIPKTHVLDGIGKK